MLAHNTGAAFSFLASAGGWQRWFLAAVAGVVSVVVAVWLTRLEPRQRILGLSLGLILGGGLGNLIDRVTLGYVVDFISWHYEEWYWPAFNIADSAICLGAVLLLWDSVLGESSKNV
jgi:signal peptidase II